MSASRIAYVGPFAFPESSATSLRVLGIATALSMGGAEVTIVSGDGGNPSTLSTRSGQTLQIHPVVEIPDVTVSKYRAVTRSLLWGGRTRKYLAGLETKPDVVIIYGVPLGYLLRLRRFTRKNQIRLICDVVEWYDPRHLPGGRFGPFAIANELAMRLVVRRADAVICISSFLARYFGNQGRQTITIPPLFELEPPDVPLFREQDGRVHVCFAGTVHGKDRLVVENAIKASAVQSLASNLVLHLIGLDESEVAKYTDADEQRSNVVFHGRVTHAESIRIVSRCDFSLLQRQPLRYAMAGFPSKVPESLLVGTAVIANETSDLRDYLVDGFNSVILEDSSLAALELGLNEAVEQIASGRRAASVDIARDAATHFAPTSRSQALAEFVRRTTHGSR